MNADGTTMTHRQVLEALSGLLLGMLVAILSSTVVSTALPRIIADLGGSQSSFTWVVTATLLALTVSTPIWGKLADLYDRKLLVQVGLVIFVTGSAVAGFAQSTGWLIACRAVQGIGAGGLTALVQVILSDLVSPRERGRYMGYLGAVMAVGTVAGPLIGGVLTDALSWRWCFFVGVPVAAAAIVVLQRTLHLPRRRREMSIDYRGALLLSAGVSLLLVWVSFAGTQFAWGSWQTAVMVPVSLALLALAVWAMSRADEPLIPLTLFRNRTVVLAVVASVSVGVAMFGTSVFLSQYLQIAKGESATASGLLTIPMMLGVMIASTAIGRVITRTGLYKRWMVLGTALLTAGLALMGTLDETTSLVELGVFMAAIGAGVGMVMQNLVLVVQNTLEANQIGAGSALVAFFRSLAGAVGVAALGAVLSGRVASTVADGLAAHGIRAPAGGDQVPDIHTLAEPVRGIVEHAYGVGVGEIFLVAAPAGLVALIAVLLMREVPLGTRSGIDLSRDEVPAAA
ncbi:MAG TPA: MDR family MFS transporter [Solirubrobacter sp.]|nr:MDR family MFS transporter [Solirubrobacter sp.]